MDEESRIKELEERIGYHFREKELVREALTHSSYANERTIRKINCNERLEFLGDAVLEQASSIYLFRHYPRVPEGQLSKMRASLVCESALASAAEKISLGDFIFLGKGEMANGGSKKPSVVSDAMEALIGALYLDGGDQAAGYFIKQYILTNIEEKEKAFIDYKSELQELVQSGNYGTIRYQVIGEHGPEHQKEFEVELVLDQKKVSLGRGRNKKAAEQMAAYEALKNLKDLKNL
ncbi:MAG: ribonuclease III [Lachnospiraceae bacterium]|nr:ribonuclease III [Lachnospiraceae bacterium]